MNYAETLDYLASIEHVPDMGILEPINLKAKPPIILPHMQRNHLANLFRDLGYRTGAEIGVSRGEYSRCLWRANPKSTIYSIDPWQVYDGYQEKFTQELMDECHKDAQRVLATTGCVIVRLFSMEAVVGFEDNSLDFVYIDGNHEFVHVAQDIAEWSKKVRSGGIVSGHDFARFKHRPVCHVKDVVKAWAYSHRIKPWFVLRGKGNSSWFWVKQ